MSFVIYFQSIIASIFDALLILRKIKHEKKVYLSTLFIFCMVLVYSIIPFFTFLYYDRYNYSISTSYATFDYSDRGILNVSLWMLLGNISILIIYLLTKKRNHNKQERSVYYNDKSLIGKTTIVCLLIGGISLALWSNAYGGIFSLILQASRVRSGFSDVNNHFAFFKHSARILLISSYASLVLIKYKYKRSLYFPIFLISTFLSILFLLANDGRMTTMFFFITLFFISIKMYDKSISFKLILSYTLLGFFAIWFLFNYDTVLFFLLGKTEDSISSNNLIERILQEFSFTIISGQKTIEYVFSNQYNSLFFNDFWSGLFAWLPVSLKPIVVQSVWDCNTQLVTSNFYGQWPCDFVTTALYDFHILGPLLFSLFYSWLFKVIETKFSISSVFQAVLYYSLIYTAIRVPLYCGLYDLVLGFFALFIFIALFSLMKKFSKSYRIANQIVDLEGKNVK